MTDFVDYPHKCPIEKRLVQLQVGEHQLLNLQLVQWLKQNGYAVKNEGGYLHFKTEEALAHFLLVWVGDNEPLKEYTGPDAYEEMKKDGVV